MQQPTHEALPPQTPLEAIEKLGSYFKGAQFAQLTHSYLQRSKIDGIEATPFSEIFSIIGAVGDGSVKLVHAEEIANLKQLVVGQLVDDDFVRELRQAHAGSKAVRDAVEAHKARVRDKGKTPAPAAADAQ